MKTLNNILIGATILTSCEKIPLEVNLADNVPDTNKVIINPDTSIIIKDSIIYIPDTSYIPMDTICNKDSSKTIQDTIIKEITKDTTIKDTIIYTPKYYDENIFIEMKNKNYSVGELFDYKAKISNLTSNIIKLNNKKENPAITYTLFNEQDIIFSEPLSENFKIELNGINNDKGGYLGMEKKEGLIDLILSRGKAEIDGKNYNVPTFEIVFTTSNKDFYFEKSGTHHMEVNVKYSVGGNNIENKFYSEKFEVE